MTSAVQIRERLGMRPPYGSMPRMDAKAIAGSALGTANRPLAARRLRRLVASQPPPYKLLLGSAAAVRPGWINTDIGWRTTLYLDATRPWPMPPGSVSHVYGDNVIEHFTLDAARVALRHARTALAPGGVVRLTTPDVEGTARLYLERSDLGRRHLDRHREHGYAVAYPVDLLRVTFATGGHHLGQMWDEESLSAELLAAGFDDVRRCEMNESDDPELRDLEHREDTPNVRATTLVLEAR
jgi:predicted SAM-dependent methyltransferase